MDWTDFTERLARELAGLDPQMVLVVHQRHQGSHYTQAFRTGEMLRAEAVSSAVLAGHLRFTEEAEDRLIGVGWERPEPQGNWTFDLPCNAPAGRFREVSAMMVTALRDVQGAGEPSDLAYEAFRGTVFLSLVELGIEPADPARITDKHIPPPLAGHDLSALASSPSIPVAEAPKPKRNITAIRLSEAKANGDRDGYLAALQKAELYVAGTVFYGDGVYVRAFTAPPAEPHRTTTLASLTATWPQPHWQLAIDDGLADSGYLDSRTLALLGGSPNTRVMQKVLPHPLVVHYLEGGYDRVAGYVHRVVDVMALTTPQRIYAALGLTDPPFAATDDSVHVLRWTARAGELLRTPHGGPDEASADAMPGGWVVEHPPFDGTGFAPGDGVPVPEFKVDSQRLPHGAEIYRFDRSGRRTLEAVFDADTTLWKSV
ncbi:TY-Chap domain-containing protein [Actinocorallia longicatena]|uniref:TY-Chap N-terminal domain-containing protein n=1 Tax=Actinocorallia longicatena TaxID=111803 RepID=A0ABP6QI67_9ACTN